MRNNIVHIGAGELTYEIRAIVDIADKLKKLGIKTNMENIGDPVAKGERIPDWMKKIVAELAMKAQPKLLILYHQMYREEDVVREMREAYKGKFVSGRDLEVY